MGLLWGSEGGACHPIELRWRGAEVRNNAWARACTRTRQLPPRSPTPPSRSLYPPLTYYSPLVLPSLLSVDAAGGEPGWPWTTARRRRQGPRAGGDRGWPGLSPAATRTPLISNWEGRVGEETGCWRCLGNRSSGADPHPLKKGVSRSRQSGIVCSRVGDAPCTT